MEFLFLGWMELRLGVILKTQTLNHDTFLFFFHDAFSMLFSVDAWSEYSVRDIVSVSMQE